MSASEDTANGQVSLARGRDRSLHDSATSGGRLQIWRVLAFEFFASAFEQPRLAACCYALWGVLKPHKLSTPPPPGYAPAPDARFNKVGINIIGPLPHSEGSRYLLTCIDRFTRCPEAVPLPNITVPAVAAAFVSTWVSRFGCPTEAITDRGEQLESPLFTDLMRLLGTTRLRFTAYHPQTNGLVERLHRHLKTSLAPQNSPSSWV